MAISQFPSPSDSDNYVLISSVTPTAASSSVDFTSLSTYKKFLITMRDVTLATTGVVRIRINNDSGSNYLNNYFNWVSSSTTIETNFSSGFFVTTTNSTTQQTRYLKIENADQEGIKLASGAARVGSSYTITGDTLYLATGVITQLNVVTTTTFNAAGTIALYGAK